MLKIAQKLLPMHCDIEEKTSITVRQNIEGDCENKATELAICLD